MPPRRTPPARPLAQTPPAASDAPQPGAEAHPGTPTPPTALGPRGTRPRGSRIDVWVTLDERAEIGDRAAQAGLSLSAYLRVAGLNQPVRSVIDQEAVAGLAKLHADLGRSAGLLKLYLSQPRPAGATARAEAVELIQALQRTQGQILALASKATRE